MTGGKGKDYFIDFVFLGEKTCQATATTHEGLWGWGGGKYKLWIGMCTALHNVLRSTIQLSAQGC